MRTFAPSNFSKCVCGRQGKNREKFDRPDGERDGNGGGGGRNLESKASLL